MIEIRVVDISAMAMVNKRYLDEEQMLQLLADQGFMLVSVTNSGKAYLQRLSTPAKTKGKESAAAPK